MLLGSLVLLGIAYSLILAAFGLAVLLSKLHRLGDLRKIEALGVTGWRYDVCLQHYKDIVTDMTSIQMYSYMCIIMFVYYMHLYIIYIII